MEEAIIGRINIINAFNSGDITSSTDAVGGIAGAMSEANVRNSYNIGKITATGQAGGIVGYTYNGGNFKNCYNAGDVINSGNLSGGICGYSASNEYDNCHNIGNISGQASEVNGEIYGLTYSTTPNVKNCSYLIKTTNANSNGATGKDANKMAETMSMSNFVNLMNSYVTENNADSTKTKLRTWTLKDGLPVFSNQ